MMHSPFLLSLFSLLLLSSFYYNVASAASYSMNNTAPCVYEGKCEWNDKNNWNGQLVPPSNNSTVYFVNLEFPSLVSVTMESFDLIVQYMSLSNVTFIVSDSTVASNTITNYLGGVNVANSNISAMSFTSPFLQATGSYLSFGSVFTPQFQASYSQIFVTTYIKMFKHIELLECTGMIFEVKSGGVMNIVNCDNIIIYLGSTFPLTITSGITNLGCDRYTYANLTLLQSPIINVFGYLPVLQLRQDGSMATISDSTIPGYTTTLSFNSPIVFQGTINGTKPSSYVSFNSEFHCDCDISFSHVNVGDNVYAKTLITTNFDLMASVNVTADVFVHNFAVAYNEGFFEAFNPSLTIFGNYVQQNGGFYASLYVEVDEEYSPVVTVSGSISMINVSVSVGVAAFTMVSEYERVPIAHSLTRSILSKQFTSFVDPNYPDKKMIMAEEEGYIYIEVKPPSFWAKNWIYIVYFSIVGVIALLIVICMVRKTRDKGAYVPTIEPHYFLKYQWEKKEPKKTCCQWFWYAIYFIVTLPFKLCTIVFTACLGTLIPLGYVFGLIEHNLVLLWAIIALLIQAGGLLDLFADIALLGKVFAVYIESELGTENQDDVNEITEFDTQETILFWSRIVITLLGSFASMVAAIMLITAVTSTPKPGAKPAAKPAPQKTTTTTTTTTKKKSSSRSFYCNKGSILAIILFAALWKVVLAGIRSYLLFIVFISLVKHRRVVESVQRKIQWLEAFLYADLMFSGIPLGILTSMQLFIYERDEEFNGDKLFELMKLGALAVDLVGASFLFYFIFAGLIHKFDAFKHHDHHHDKHHDKDHKHDAHHGHENSNIESGHVSIQTEDTPLLTH